MKSTLQKWNSGNLFQKISTITFLFPNRKTMVFKNGTWTKMPHLSNSTHYIIYNSMYAVFWKSQNYRDRKSSCQVLGGRWKRHLQRGTRKLQAPCFIFNLTTIPRSSITIIPILHFKNLNQKMLI